MNSAGGFIFGTSKVKEEDQFATVGVKDVASLTASKMHLYRALLVKGKLFVLTMEGKIFLPPYRCANITFLRQILSGEKKYFLQTEIPSVRVLRHKLISVDRVLKRVRKSPAIAVYLPDYEEGEEKRMDRDFLFALVNKLDGDFFNRANQMIENRAVSKLREKKPEHTLKIKTELLAVLR
jgi:hypothetical protein